MASKFDSLIDEVTSSTPTQSAAPTVEKYGALIDEVTSTAPLHDSLFNAAGVNPDEEAKKRKLSGTLAMPAVLLPANAEELALLKQNQPEELVKRAPATAKFLTKPENAKITGLDNIESLTNIEATLRRTPKNFKERLQQMEATGADLNRFDKTLGEMAVDGLVKAASGVNTALKGAAELARPTSYLLSALFDASTLAGRAILNPDQQQTDPFPTVSQVRRGADRAQAKLEKYSEFWQEKASAPSKALKEKLDKASLRETPALLLTKPALALDMLAQSAAYLAPSVAAARGGALATSVFTMLTEAGDAAVSAREEAKKAGMSPEQQDVASLTSAVITAPLVFFAHKLLGAGKLEADFFTKGTVGHSLSQALMTEIATGTIEEGANQFGVNVGASTYDPARQLGANVAKAGFIGGLLEGTHAGGMVAVDRALDMYIGDARKQSKQNMDRTDDAAKAEDLFATMSDLSKQAATNPLRARDTTAFREFTDAVAEETDLKEVYVDGTTALNAINADEGLRQSAPELVASIEEAASNGTDVAISVQDYLTHIAGSQADAMLLPELKSDPNGSTYTQVQEFYQQQQALFTKEVQAVEQANEPVMTREEFDAKRQTVQTTVTDLGEGQKRYTTPDGATLTVMEGTTVAPRDNSIIGFEVPEDQRGQGKGGVLLRSVLANYDKNTVSAAVSSEPSLRAFYAEGFRPISKPEATIDEALAMMREDSSVTVVFNQAPPATYDAYIAQHKNQREVYARDVEQVQTKLLDQFTTANRFTGPINRAYVVPLLEFYKTQAKRMGMMPSELYNKFPFRVQSLLDFNQATDLMQLPTATLDDFRPENVANILDKTNWTILTAERPYGQPSPDDAQRLEQLEQQLIAEGRTYKRVAGKYGGEETSFVIVGITPEEALNIARQNQQDAVLTRDGFLYTDGTRTPAKGTVQVFDKEPSDFFSTITHDDGSQTTFAVDLDFRVRLEEGEVYVNPDRVKEHEGLDTNEGRKYRDFFASITSGTAGAPKTPAASVKVLNRDRNPEVVNEFMTHSGNFDRHIEASIPGFRDIQFVVAEAITKTFSDAKVLDIGASEGALVKTVAALGTDIEAVALDPNPAMAQTFETKSQVEGATYSMSALGSKEQEGELAWTEDDGTEIRYFKPEGKFDVVHEAMVFQFISNDRQEQVGRVAELLKEDGVAIFEEKFIEGEGLSKEQWKANEATKDAFKEQFFPAEELAAKKESVLVGMHANMVSPGSFEKTLQGKFKFVHRFWTSGNFMGYVASNDKAKFDAMVANLGDTSSPFDWTQNPEVTTEGDLTQTLREGQVAITGYHFSKVKRDVLSGAYYGTGIKGAEAERLKGAKDSRIRQRLYFYVDEGRGVFPEYGVGSAKHKVNLPNMYDASKNPLRLPTRNAEGERDMNVFESAVIDAGFDGYYIKEAFHRQGAAVLLGDAARSVTPEPEGVVNQSAPIFYSALTRAVENHKQAKGSPAQWKGILKNLPGVKPDEIEAVGVMEWLDLQGPSVTKEDLVAFLKDNGVQVEEVIYRERPENAYTDDDIREFAGVSDDEWIDASNDQRRQWREEFYSHPDRKELRAKYDGWRPGEGTNYKELLLKLRPQTPTAEMPEPVYAYQVIGYQPKDGFKTEAEAQAYIDEANQQLENMRELAKTDGQVLRAVEIYESNLATYPLRINRYETQESRKARERVTEEQNLYRSSHWTEDRNVLAHIRFDEVVDSQGNRTMRVIETQSDWAQEGRKKGFDLTTPEKNRLIEIDQLLNRPKAGEVSYAPYKTAEGEWALRTTDGSKYFMGDLNSRKSRYGFATFENEEEAQKVADAISPLTEEQRLGLRQEREQLEARRTTGLPTAPFVTKTDAWVGLTVKRIIRYAAENDFDKVAFITGEQAADVFDLSKQLSSVFAEKLPSGEYTVQAEGKDGEQVFGKTVAEADLEDLVGKDLAKTIIEEAPQNPNGKAYKGLDLKVGGEGMRTFYDTIVPKVVNKVSASLGGPKLEKTVIVTTDPDAARYSVMLQNGKVVKTTESLANAQAIKEAFEGSTILEYAGDSTEQLALTITPALKEKALGGMPLFQFAGENAQTADQFALDTAKKLLASGRDAEVVRKETGWYKGADGLWRFEIADDEARWNEVKVTLGQAYGIVEAESTYRIASQAEKDEFFGSKNAQAERTLYRVEWDGKVRMGWDIASARRALAHDAFEKLNGRKVSEAGTFNYESSFKDGADFFLSEILQHPKLYAAYPQLKNIRVIVKDDPTLAGALGSYDPRTKYIELKPGRAKEETLSTLLHEVQHAIQDIEGFASGGNASDWFVNNIKEGLTTAGNKLADAINAWKDKNQTAMMDANEASQKAKYALMYDSAVKLKAYADRDKPSGALRLIRNEMQWIHDREFAFSDEALQLQLDFYRIPKAHKMKERNAFLADMANRAAEMLLSHVPSDFQTQVKDDPRKLKSVVDALRREALRAHDKLEPLRALAKNKRTADFLASFYASATPREIYRALAGEVEARNTQARLSMTDEQRRATPPQQTADIKPDEIIVVFGGIEVSVPNLSLAQPVPEGVRGTFNINTLTMSLMQGADLSTTIHEMGHFFLVMLQHLANTSTAPQEIVDDYAKALEWFGVTKEQWESMTLEEQRPYHEQWAESFELWTIEGKAPTQELQSIFSRFRAWMLSVYKSVEEFLKTHPAAGKLNDEVRAVFGRLLAAEEAIRETEAAQAYQPLFTTKDQAGAPQSEVDDYVALGEQASQKAIEELQARSLRDMRWLTNARSRAIRELQNQARAKRKEMTEAVTAEVMSEPVNQARTFLRSGIVTDAATGDEIKAVQGYKLDKATVDAMYPEGALDRPDLTALRGMTMEDGLDPDVVAGMFGFNSGDALIRSIITDEDPKAKIQGLTDQRMLEEYGDLIDEQSVQRAADEAVHNEARARFLATGLKILSKAPISVTQLNKAAKNAAEETIATKRVRDLRPKQYTAAESKANRAALAAVAKDPQEAIRQQRNALLNNRLARAAQDALTEVDKALRFLTKFNNEGTRKNLDLEYLEQIDALLEPFDLRKGESLKTIDARQSLAEWVQQQEDLGFEPTIDAEAIAASRQKSYKNMTMEELRGLIDTIKQIEHLGRMKKKILTAKEKADFAEAIAEAKASIAVNANRSVPERGTPTDVVGLLGQWARQMVAAHRKFASYIRELDGGRPGVLFDLLLRSATEASAKETEMRAQASERIGQLFDALPTRIGGVMNLKARKRLIPGTNISLTDEERIMFVLNWGNEGNRQRMLDGGITGRRGISEVEARAIIDTLTKEEMDFVQGTFDFIAEYKPAIEELERTLTGKTPQWVEPTPIETRHGTYAGGYFPAKYDTVLSTRSDALEAATDLRSAMKGAFGAASARNGYTKERARAVVGRPLLLNFNVISRHVNEVIHRLAWQPWLVDANRIVRALDSDLRQSLGAEATKEIQDVLVDIARGEAPASTPIEVAINRVRTGTSIVGMGWKVTTALLQPSGLTNSFARIGGRHMARALGRYFANPLAADAWANENSAVMRNRGRTLNREINEILNTVRSDKTTSAVTASYFYLIGRFQRMVDVPTYIGAYERAVEELGLENASTEEERNRITAKAHDIAGQTVKDVQGGGEMMDLAKAQRGSPAMKLFTNFYSYMNTVYNMNVEAFRTTNFKSPTETAIFVAEMVAINFVPVVLSVALKNSLKGSCDWDDTECLLGNYKSEQISHFFGQLLLLREMGVAVDVATGGDAYGYSGPAGLRFFADLYKSGQQAAQGEVDLPLIKSVNNAAGALLHYPAGALNNVLETAVAIENGEVEGASIVPALIAGPPK